jgi:hypothetical protein
MNDVMSGKAVETQKKVNLPLMNTDDADLQKEKLEIVRTVERRVARI